MTYRDIKFDNLEHAYQYAKAIEFNDIDSRRVSRGGGPRGLGPPLEKAKKKKKKKKVIRANIKLFHLYFATFLVENIIFSAIF